MASPVIINPTLTLAGQAAAFDALNTGLELKIDGVSFGRAHYDPTGDEVLLRDPVGSRIPVAGASRPTPYQIRMVSTWREDVGQVGIGEIGWWAGDVLVFVWSKGDGTMASYKTDGVAYVLFNDLSLKQVPAGTISFVVDPNESVALAALAAHEGASNAHPQYVLRSKFPDYQGHLWGDVAGTANDINLGLPDIVELTQYIKGNRFTFLASMTNTGPTTINVNGVGAVEVFKTGGVPLTAGSIIAGGVYDVYFDGINFQLTAGAGFASAEATEAELLLGTNPASTSWVSVRRLLKLAERLAPRASPIFTGDPTAPTAEATDKDSTLATTAFVRAAMALFGIGATTPMWVGSVDTMTEGGIFSVGTTTVGGLPNLNPPISQGSQLLNMPYTTGVQGSGVQVLWDRIYERVLWRRRDLGAWKTWRSIWHSGDTPKVTGPLDTTPGAMLTPGTYGLGTAIFTAESDLSTFFTPGNYITTSSTLTSLPPGWSSAYRYSLVVEGTWGGDSPVVQRLTTGFYAGQQMKTAIRSYTVTGGWSDWTVMAPLKSPQFTGSPEGPTPARGNSSTLLATTNFVREQGPCYPETMFSTIAGSTLGVANLNKVAGLTSTGNIYLPPKGTPIPVGSTFTVMFFSNFGKGTLIAPAGGFISVGTGQRTSISFTSNDLPTVVMCMGDGTYCLLSGGSIMNLPDFAANAGNSAGISTRWGSQQVGITLTQRGTIFLPPDVSTYVCDFTFPLAFPNSCDSMVANIGIYSHDYDVESTVRLSKQSVSVGVATYRGFQAQAFMDNHLSNARCIHWLATGW